MLAVKHENIYKVGGCIRDAMLNRKCHDIDYSVEAGSFADMRDIVISLGGEIFLESPQHFTIRARVGREAADFVLCRRDGEYKDGRRPENVFIGSIYDDLARRDFTMNAIAVNTGNHSVVDPHAGSEDIHRKLIRCVGSTEDRMAEDGLRVFRALRFAVVLDFALSGELIDFLHEVNGSAFDGVSVERVQTELKKMFSVSSKESFELLRAFPRIFEWVMDETGIWFEPTLKQR